MHATANGGPMTHDHPSRLHEGGSSQMPPKPPRPPLDLPSCSLQDDRIVLGAVTISDGSSSSGKSGALACRPLGGRGRGRGSRTRAKRKQIHGDFEWAIASREAAENDERPKFVWRKRDEQTSRLYNLQLDINDIKMEIHRLRAAREMLLRSRCLNRHDDSDGSGLKTLLQYFEVFQRGLADSPYDATSYLYHVMAPDVRVNDFGGHEQIVEQWRIHSACFSQIDFRYRDGIVVPLTDTTTLLRCTASFSSVITRRTLEIMFPHIAGSQRFERMLLGRTLSGVGSYDFVYDSRKRQFVRCVAVMDLMAVFARLVPDLRDLARLFDQAQLRDEIVIGEDDSVAGVADAQEVNEEYHTGEATKRSLDIASDVTIANASGPAISSCDECWEISL